MLAVKKWMPNPKLLPCAVGVKGRLYLCEGRCDFLAVMDKLAVILSFSPFCVYLL